MHDVQMMQLILSLSKKGLAKWYTSCEETVICIEQMEVLNLSVFFLFFNNFIEGIFSHTYTNISILMNIIPY